MRYTNRTILISQSRITKAEGRLARQQKVVDRLENARHPADHATALLLVMEQSLLSMKRFLTTLEWDLERTLGATEKSLRRKAARRRKKAQTDKTGQQVVEVLRGEGIDAGAAATAVPYPSTQRVGERRQLEKL